MVGHHLGSAKSADPLEEPFFSIIGTEDWKVSGLLRSYRIVREVTYPEFLVLSISQI